MQIFLKLPSFSKGRNSRMDYFKYIMKQDFLDYIKQTFAFSSEEMQDFQTALSKPLKKTIRINTNKISVEDFRVRTLESPDSSWTLTATPL